MSVTFAEPTPEACAFIARNIRPLDREELRLTGSKNVEQAIRHSVEVSPGSAFIAYEGEEPIAALGMSPNYLLGEGVPWMLGTPKVARHPRDLIVHAREKIAIWLDELPLLMNEVWTGNRPALTFLRHVGFSFAPPRQNVYGADMQLFYARRS